MGGGGVNPTENLPLHKSTGYDSEVSMETKAQNIVRGFFLHKFHIIIQSTITSILINRYRLIGNCLVSCSRIFPSYRDATITGEKMQNVDLCSMFTAFWQSDLYRAIPATCMTQYLGFYTHFHLKNFPIKSPSTTLAIDTKNLF